MEIRSYAEDLIYKLDGIDQKKLENGIKKLTKKEKKAIILCSKIINGELNPEKYFNFDANKLEKLTNKLVKKIEKGEKKTHSSYLITKLFKGCLNVVGLRIGSSEVIQAIKGKSLTQSSLNRILIEMKEYKEKNPNTEINFSNFLKDRGYSSNLKRLNFRLNGLTVQEQKGLGRAPAWATDLFKHINFDKIQFTDCNFECVNFRHSTFNRCTFDHCNLRQSAFYQTKIIFSHFTNVNLRDSTFDYSIFSGVQFYDSHLNYASFYKTRMGETSYNTCQMEGANFLNAKAVFCTFQDSLMENCLLYEAKKDFKIDGGTEHKITKPIIAMPWSIAKPGITANRVYSSLKAQGSIPLRTNYSPPVININSLNEEIANEIIFQQETPNPERLSIPSTILESTKKNPEKYSTIEKIRQEAKNIASHVDAILLPGGADIQPEFYGEKINIKTQVDKDYRRSILEFALLDEARQFGLPVMGICRGSQMGNIFYGGKINQHIDGQLFRIQSYTTRPVKKGEAKGLIRSAVGRGSLKGFSVHHQANSNISDEHFETVITYQGIPKAFEGKRGAPMIYTQFHPEIINDRSSIVMAFISMFLSKKNNNFFEIFIDSANVHRKKSALNQQIKSIYQQKLKNK